jgi:hypothetical protein
MFFLKVAVLIFALVAAFPFSRWLKRNPHEVPKVWILMGLLPFVFMGLGVDQPLYITLFGGQWSGFLRGAEISVLDVLALAIYFALPRARHTLPFRFSMLLYFIAVLLSVFQSGVPTMTVFYCWQLARIFFLYVVVVRACADERVPLALLTGMTIGLCLQTGIEFYQRLIMGVLRTGGTLGHENNIGIMSHFVIFPLFALLLAGQRGWQPVVGPLAGMISSILTVSRAAIGLNGLGLVLAFVLSALQGWTSRKAVIALFGAAMIAVFLPIMLSTIQERNVAELEESVDTRTAFARVAAMIFEDHPMGIGANNYVRIANIGGYNSRADLPYSVYGMSVHNVYWLVAAETGYLGICTFVLMLLRIMFSAFICGWKNKKDRRGALLLGLGVALMLVYVHSLFEFVLMFAGIQYTFAIIAGLVSGLTIQLGYWRPTKEYGARIGVGVSPANR